MLISLKMFFFCLTVTYFTCQKKTSIYYLFIGVKCFSISCCFSFFLFVCSLLLLLFQFTKKNQQLIPVLNLTRPPIGAQLSCVKTYFNLLYHAWSNIMNRPQKNEFLCTIWLTPNKFFDPGTLRIFPF